MNHPLDACFSTWSHQGKSGYVVLSEGDKSTGHWQDKCFSWPDEEQAIVQWFDTRRGVNLYWSPAIYDKPRRRREHVSAGSVLYADLDEVHPESCHTIPTVAWESSPGRYQALWWLDKPLVAQELEKKNQALTYETGADKSGWDLTQVLRIPETVNYKYPERPRGVSLWASGVSYRLEDVVKKNGHKPEVPLAVLGEDEPGTFTKLLARYRKQMPSHIYRLLQYPPSRVEPGARSDTLWKIERELVKAQIPLDDAFTLLKLSSWNKFAHRRDENKRLFTELEKAYKLPTGGDEDGEIDPSSRDRFAIQSSLDLLQSTDIQPGWLIQDLWLKGSHGIVAGEPKTFKSTVALDMAVSIATGVPLWGRFTVDAPGPVLVIQNENAPWIMKDRLQKIMASKRLVGDVVLRSQKVLDIKFPDAPDVHFINSQGFNLSDPENRTIAEDIVAELSPKLIVFDPLYLMFDDDLNSAKDLNPVLRWLIELHDDSKAGVMLIHHWKKGGANQRGGQRLLGSTTLHGWIESALYLEDADTQSDEEDNLSKRIVIEREFRAAGLMPKLNLTISMGPAGDPSYLVEVEDSVPTGVVHLLDLLSMYPRGLTLHAIAKELKISRNLVVSLVGKAKDKLKVSGSGSRVIYAIKTQEN